MIGRTLFLILMILLVSAPVGSQNQGSLSLRVESGDPPKTVLEMPVRPGELFYFHYIHSSDKTPVQDTFQVAKNGQLILREEAFLWYGSGLEFQDHHAVRISHAGRWTKVLLNRPLASLPVRVGRVSQQILILQGRSYRLDGLAKPGEVLLLSTAR